MAKQHKGVPDPVLAEQYAQLQHAGQLYNEEVPYTTHLKTVVSVCTRFGVTDPEMLCAAWLHDSIEDTNTSYNDIKVRFGVGTAELVYGVTNELGRNRKERSEKTNPKIVAGGLRTVFLKLADRIANVEYGLANQGKRDMYVKEFPDFEQALRYYYVFVPKDEPDALEKAYQVRHPSLESMWEYLSLLLKEKE